MDSVLSRTFALGRGTKQGDPLSTLLFSAVLEDVFRDVRPKWTQKKYGLDMSLGVDCHLSNLCFADDVVLIATTMHQIKEMTSDLKEAASARGLKIHSGKTKILKNVAAESRQRAPEHFTIGSEKYAVLSLEESTKYLGRKICYKDPHETEFDNRVAKAWGAFSNYKQELVDRRHRLKDRLRLFDAVVTPTLLYGCEACTLRIDQQRRLQVLQRKMLRMVLNARRRTVTPGSSSNDSSAAKDENDAAEFESWPDFLKRTAQWTDEQLEKANLCQWSVQWRRIKWKWAAKLADAENSKWSAVATMWQPLLHSRFPCGRLQARPKKRWEQDIVDFLASNCPEESKKWTELAKDQGWWLSRTEAFATSCK